MSPLLLLAALALFSLVAAGALLASIISGETSTKPAASQFGQYLSLSSALFTSFNALLVAMNFVLQRRDQAQNRLRLDQVEKRDAERRATEELKELISAFHSAVERVSIDGAATRFTGAQALKLIAPHLSPTSGVHLAALSEELEKQGNATARANALAISDVEAVGSLLQERIEQFSIDRSRGRLVKALLTSLTKAEQNVLACCVKNTTSPPAPQQAGQPL